MKRNMERSDFQVIAIIGLILGVPLLVGGIFAATYHTEIVIPFMLMNPVAVYPYAAYSGSLLGGGAVSIFVGIAFALLATQEETSVKPPPSPTNPKQPSSTYTKRNKDNYDLGKS
jgi:hypothetical protein